MKYPKPSLPFSDQADLLISRGLGANSKADIIKKLKAVSYFRLSGYWFPFRLAGSSNLASGTTLDTVWRRYTFDRQLRLLVLDAIERVEVAIRTQIVNQHTQKYGPFGYVDRVNLPGLDRSDHRDLLTRIRDQDRRSSEAFVEHFHTKYTSETDLPLWMACELMTFGGIFTLYRGIETGLKQSVAMEFGVSDRVLQSWLATLNQIRNLCAHHARLWNRGLGISPMIPRARKHPQWHTPVPIHGNRLFAAMTVLRYLLRLSAPKSGWPTRFENLLINYPEIPLAQMGFPANWKESPLWQKLLAAK